MKTHIQIVAITDRGVNMIWDELRNDFFSYETEVPNTDLSELQYAKDKAKIYPGIVDVWAEVINSETNELIKTVS
jgi:hypothetical protein